MSLQRPLDLAQPFLIDVHPIGCDCTNCEAEREQPSLLRSLGQCIVLGTGGVIAGQVAGHALNASGILALLGIG
jgi:hypothetical protein